MQAFHNMAVDMLGDAVGVDVLSTLADVDVADMSDKGNVSSVDQLEKVERTVYNEAGVSQMQFNSEGSVALERSISNDEGSLTDLIQQFEEYLIYRVNILPTTVYNYKDMASTYREQTMLGYSKLLTQVALGMPQTVVMSAAMFENQMLKLDEVFIPPQMSSTMSGNDSEGEDNNKDSDTTQSGDTGNVQPHDEGGRPEVDTVEKSETTVETEESRQ